MFLFQNKKYPSTRIFVSVQSLKRQYKILNSSSQFKISVQNLKSIFFVVTKITITCCIKSRRLRVEADNFKMAAVSSCQCGSVVVSNHRFCPQCGVELDINGENIITYYFSRGFECKSIVNFLMKRHNIQMSEQQSDNMSDKR